jgi:hypothetical protein
MREESLGGLNTAAIVSLRKLVGPVPGKSGPTLFSRSVLRCVPPRGVVKE